MSSEGPAFVWQQGVSWTCWLQHTNAAGKDIQADPFVITDEIIFHNPTVLLAAGLSSCDGALSYARDVVACFTLSGPHCLPLNLGVLRPRHEPGSPSFPDTTIHHTSRKVTSADYLTTTTQLHIFFERKETISKKATQMLSFYAHYLDDI